MITGIEFKTHTSGKPVIMFVSTLKEVICFNLLPKDRDVKVRLYVRIKKCDQMFLNILQYTLFMTQVLYTILAFTFSCGPVRMLSVWINMFVHEMI